MRANRNDLGANAAKILVQINDVVAIIDVCMVKRTTVILASRVVMWMIAVTSQCTNKLAVKGPLVIVIRTLLVVVTTIAITLMGFMITIGLNRDPACITSVGRSKPMMPRTSQCHVNHDSDVGEFYQECLHVIYVCFWSPNDPLELNRGQDRFGRPQIYPRRVFRPATG